MATLEYRASSPAPVIWPLAVGRSLADYVVAGTDLRAWQESCWPDAVPEGCWQAEEAWVNVDDVNRLLEAGPGNVVVSGGGHPLAGWSSSEEAGHEKSLPAGDGTFLLWHPWDVLRLNEIIVGGLQYSEILGEVSPQAIIEGNLILGPGSKILPGVFIEGNVIIGSNCRVGPNCYLRGNTSMGDECHIGQAVELKNSLLGSRTNVGHLSYVGDSVLGDDVNFGAGTITSNFRHDGLNHRTMVEGQLVDTGRRKFGAIVGDRVHTGIHTAIYPGRKLGAGSTTRPGEIVQRDLPDCDE